jgi:hypothetical protein
MTSILTCEHNHDGELMDWFERYAKEDRIYKENGGHPNQVYLVHTFREELKEEFRREIEKERFLVLNPDKRERKCSNCDFYFLNKAGYKSGECRGHFPTGTRNWPTVFDDDWCGKFRGKQ